MKIRDKVVVVTGGASGIGEALCVRFAAEGARRVVVSDVDADGAVAVAEKIGGLAIAADAGNESDVQRLIAESRKVFGRIDIFCCNAGIAMEGGVDVSDADWERIWHINFMAHVYAARALLPSMLERGKGAILVTASAAWLLTQIGSAPYSVTKHAAVALAEWLAVTYGDRGIEVFCLCPQGVRTNMMDQFEDESAIGAYLSEVAISPEEVAEAVVEAMAEGRFMILPHPEVAEYFQRKAGDYDRWLSGMQRFKASFEGASTEPTGAAKTSAED